MKTLQSLANTLIATTLQSCKQILTEHYGLRLQGVVLFGSAA